MFFEGWHASSVARWVKPLLIIKQLLTHDELFTKWRIATVNRPQCLLGWRLMAIAGLGSYCGLCLEGGFSDQSG